ncbi:MAG TPA: S41 family peptidase [Edaphocola sp.]|nr:S41 family peptidase [Edaphocola sp.]
MQKKLYKKHPDYDYYTSKIQLDKSFDSLRNAIKQPMTSKEFYFLISPLIAQVHQAHMSTTPAFKKNNKERRKYLNKMGPSPLLNFDYIWIDNKLLVEKNNASDTMVKIGDQLISINGIEVQKIYDKYISTISSDGYNQTGLDFFFARKIPMFYRNELKDVDIANYTFKNEKGLYEKVFVRKLKNEKVKPKVDTLKNIEPSHPIKNKDSLARINNLKEKELEEAEKKEERMKTVYGYDKKDKEYIRSLKFLDPDSNIAYFKIKSFSGGIYKKAYGEIFDSIENVGSNTLVLDLRDNVGGRAAEVGNLFGYFVDTNYKMFLPSKVSSKTSLLSPGMYKNTPKLLWPILSLYYPTYVFSRYFWTSKLEDGFYYYNGLKGIKFSYPQTPIFAGKIYLLVNGGTFSAASIIASRMSTLSNVTVLGEETGGDYNGTVAGVLPIYTLPNSKIKWRVGLMHIKPYNQRPLKGRGVMPEKYFKTSITDLKLKRDVILDWLKQLGSNSLEF